MPTPSRMGMSRLGAPLLREASFSAWDLAVAAGISPVQLAALVELGLVEPSEPGGSEFNAGTASRLRRMLRLRADLEVSFVAAAIITDLVERLERLESELARVVRTGSSP